VTDGPQRDGWADVGIATVVAICFGLVLLGTLDDLGYARDEGFYFHAARRYEAWFTLLLQDSGAALQRVDEFWATNHEHPALIKSLFALSHMVFWKAFRAFDMEGTSYRIVGIALSSTGVGLTYLWGARACSRTAGMIAALALATMPRFFFHAHLACFDAPVVTMWTLCAYTYWRALDRGGALRMLLVGVTFALALNTKHNAWFLPIVTAGHALGWWLWHRSDRTHLRRSLRALASMALVGPLLFYATWPWIWHDTVPRLTAYAEFHLEHVYYNMEYLGSNYYEPPMPRSYAFVMTAATVPVVTLAAAVVGIVRHRSIASRTALLWALAVAVQYAAWLRPTTPIFGGTKHWMTAYPFLALFAGVGASSLLDWAAERTRAGVWRAPWLRAVYTIALALPGLLESARAHPWGLSAYTPLVGGAPGAASLGFNRGFWGYTTGAVADYLNETAPRRARIYVHDTAWPAWQMLLADGRLREDLVGVGQVAQADLALYHHELHMQGVEYQTWVALETTTPVYVAGLDGVPVIWIYERRDLRGR
jgi:4-amino-4-deoxy-L-arabinose transferase-like glycosyltransferase